jgi:hypothetical protein
MKSWSKTVIALGFFRELTAGAQCKPAKTGELRKSLPQILLGFAA